MQGISTEASVGRSPGAVDRLLGVRIRNRRIELGMSQERLGELLGVTFQQVQKYEKGINRIAASRLLAIAETLQVPVGRLFDGMTNTTHAPSEVEAALSAPGAAELVILYNSVTNKRVRAKVVELVRTLIDAS